MQAKYQGRVEQCQAAWLIKGSGYERPIPDELKLQSEWEVQLFHPHVSPAGYSRRPAHSKRTLCFGIYCAMKLVTGSSACHTRCPMRRPAAGLSVSGAGAQLPAALGLGFGYTSLTRLVTKASRTGLAAVDIYGRTSLSQRAQPSERAGRASAAQKATNQTAPAAISKQSINYSSMTTLASQSVVPRDAEHWAKSASLYSDPRLAVDS